MAVSYEHLVGSTQNKTASQTMSLTCSETLVAGDDVFVSWAGDTGGSSFGVVDSGTAAITWTEESSYTYSGNCEARLFRGNVTTGGSLTQITISWTTNVTAKAMVAGLFKGVGTKDDTATHFGNGASLCPKTNSDGNTPDTASWQSGDLCIASFAYEGPSDDTHTEGSGGSGSPTWSAGPTKVGQNGPTAGGPTSNITSALVFGIASSDESGTEAYLSLSNASTRDQASAGAVYSPAAGDYTGAVDFPITVTVDTASSYQALGAADVPVTFGVQTVGILRDTGGNTFEGGTDGVTITDANSGGDSGDQLSGTTHGTSNTMEYDTGQARGLVSAHWVMPATVTEQSWIEKDNIDMGAADVWFAVDYRKVSNPGGSFFYLIRLDDYTDTRTFGMHVRSDGLIGFAGSGSEVTGIRSTTAIPDNQWVRIEGRVNCTDGEIEWWLYLDPDSETADETNSATGVAMGDGVKEILSGAISSLTNLNGEEWWVDNFRWSNEAKLGPAVQNDFFGAVDFPITFTVDTSGQYDAFGATDFPITVGIDTVGFVLGAVDLQVTASIDTDSQYQALGAVDLPIIAGITVDAIYQALAAAELTATLTVDTSGAYEAFGALELPIVIQIDTDGEIPIEGFQGAASLEITFDSVVAGEYTALGALELAETVGIATVGSYTALGTIDVPVTVGVVTDGSYTALGQAVIPVVLAVDSAGQYHALGASDLPITVDIYSDGPVTASPRNRLLLKAGQ